MEQPYRDRRSNQGNARDGRDFPPLVAAQQDSGQHGGNDAAECEGQAEERKALCLRVVLRGRGKLNGFDLSAGGLQLLGNAAEELRVRCAVSACGVDGCAVRGDGDGADCFAVLDHVHGFILGLDGDEVWVLFLLARLCLQLLDNGCGAAHGNGDSRWPGGECGGEESPQHESDEDGDAEGEGEGLVEGARSF